MSPWKITKTDSSSPNIKLRVGTYTHPDVNENEIKQVIFFFTGRESGSKSTIQFLKI